MGPMSVHLYDVEHDLIWVVVFALVHKNCSFMYSLIYANHIHVQMYSQQEYGRISLLSRIRSSNSLHNLCLA